MYSGQIQSRGPRYCPSIEDKIVRFGERDGHQIFLEPEGLDDTTVYPNGISTSLPEDVQLAHRRVHSGAWSGRGSCGRAMPSNTTTSIRASSTRRSRPSASPGFSWPARSTAPPATKRPPPRAWSPGLNAAARAGGGAPIVFDRAEGYLGVMIDDLVTRGVTEPYRMFTSRAEYRLTLRADNADQRLTDKGIALGCVGPERAHLHQAKMAALEEARAMAETLSVTPNEAARHGLELRQGRPAAHGFRASVVSGYRRAPISRGSGRPLADFDRKIAEQLEIDAKYAVYLTRQAADVESFRRDESLVLGRRHRLCGPARAFQRGPPQAANAPAAHHRPRRPDRWHYAGGADAAGGAYSPGKPEARPRRRMTTRGEGTPAGQSLDLSADRERALALVPVSRETFARLDRFVELLIAWQAAHQS